ncbi:hypothetical protein BDQ94DRAFT_145122, partial [Aspergillus welwitschiae]
MGLVCQDRDRMTRGLSHTNPPISVWPFLLGLSNMCSYSLGDESTYSCMEDNLHPQM